MNNKTILAVPLDERPCNYYFPSIMPQADYNLIMPPLNIMGLAKKPANVDALAEWVLQNAKFADYIILAMDTLIYGGLIPSRLHYLSATELCNRADIVKKIRTINPAAKIYAFQTIMRCPWYSLSYEEPDYYAEYGSEIHNYGKLTHKQQLGIISANETQALEEVKISLNSGVLEDFSNRREKNLTALRYTLDLIGGGYIDKFIIPQDDSAKYGFTAMDQQRTREYIKQKGLQLSAPIYPAADDTGMTMLASAVNDIHKAVPKVYVYYSSASGATVTPSFEDRSVDATVKSQIMAAGCLRVYSITECDIMLAINIGSEMLYEENAARRAVAYDIERSLGEYLEQIEYALTLGKVVAVADIAYPTHSDLELLELMRDKDLLLRVHAYAGWNTASNTIGTVICESVLFLLGKDEKGNKAFLLHRYYDDAGYCSHTRTWVDENILPPRNLTVFKMDGEMGECTVAAEKELTRYMRENYPDLARHVESIEVTSPWNRTFEMDFKIKTKF